MLATLNARAMALISTLTFLCACINVFEAVRAIRKYVGIILFKIKIILNIITFNIDANIELMLKTENFTQIVATSAEAEYQFLQNDN